jgi:hypothetical protein
MTLLKNRNKDIEINEKKIGYGRQNTTWKVLRETILTNASKCICCGASKTGKNPPRSGAAFSDLLVNS